MALDVMFNVEDLKQKPTVFLSAVMCSETGERTLKFLSGLRQGNKRRKQAQEREGFSKATSLA